MSFAVRRLEGPFTDCALPWHDGAQGFALFNLKQYAEAAHAFQEGLKLSPADKVLRQVRVVGQLHWGMGRATWI